MEKRGGTSHDLGFRERLGETMEAPGERWMD